MATVSEPKWRTMLFVAGAVLGIILTVSGIVTNVFGPLDRGKSQVDSSPASTADTTNQALHNAEKQASAWVVAFNARDIDALTSMSKPPFFLDEENILLSQSEIRTKYERDFSRQPDEPAPHIDKLEAATIRDLKATGWNPANDRFMSKMNLSDDDIAVSFTKPTS